MTLRSGVVPLLALLLLASACRERFVDTPGMVKARAIQTAEPGSGGGKSRASQPPKGFAEKLSGGDEVFADDFERETLGPKWKAETPRWKLQDGQIINRHADNDGLWLLEPLPEGDLRIEFDARSDSFSKKGRNGEKKETFPGDLKCEAFAEKPEHQTGYLFIFGGWNNRVNRIARLEEHGDGEGARVVDGPKHAVKAGHTYRMKVVRIGTVMAWYADGTYLGHMDDPELIRGPHFAFNNWRSHLTFDNLAIYELD